MEYCEVIKMKSICVKKKADCQRIHVMWYHLLCKKQNLEIVLYFACREICSSSVKTVWE